MTPEATRRLGTLTKSTAVTAPSASVCTLALTLPEGTSMTTSVGPASAGRMSPDSTAQTPSAIVP
ncbi:Uncharacterised protein [Mycobacteroides abscessus subsp. abscessus]|nr:Uncharacterised protein [Mycobacteroides abscessus subsp. abscessus]